MQTYLPASACPLPSLAQITCLYYAFYLPPFFQKEETPKFTPTCQAGAFYHHVPQGQGGGPEAGAWAMGGQSEWSRRRRGGDDRPPAIGAEPSCARFPRGFCLITTPCHCYPLVHPHTAMKEPTFVIPLPPHLCLPQVCLPACCHPTDSARHPIVPLCHCRHCCRRRRRGWWDGGQVGAYPTTGLPPTPPMTEPREDWKEPLAPIG